MLHKHIGQGNMTRAMRGIYRIARFPPSENEDLVVLWLWSDQQAIFSHETALRLHDLSDALPARIHLTLPSSTSRRKKSPQGAVLHFADVPDSDWRWLGPVRVTTPSRSILDVASAHGDAQLVAQALEQGIRGALFGFEGVAAAGRYVAEAQGWTAAGSEFVEEQNGDGNGAGLADGSGSGEGGLISPWYARSIRGTCSKPPPADWPALAADLGRETGAELRAARYLPSRTMVVEFKWRASRLPDERQLTRLKKRLAKRFAWR